MAKITLTVAEVAEILRVQWPHWDDIDAVLVYFKDEAGEILSVDYITLEEEP